MAPLWLSVPIAVALAAVHLVAGRLPLGRAVPRRIWLSAAGGVSVSYVFVHLLPEIATRQAQVAGGAAAGGMAQTLADERLLFLAALAGFVVFFGLEGLARSRTQSSGSESTDTQQTSESSLGVFWLHVGSFAAYNGLVGYLLVHREETGTASLVLFATAMGLHFLVNDFGLADHHQADYSGVARWLLAAAVLAGFTVGLGTALTHETISLLFAFLSGAIVLNVIKEELPPDRESRFWAFAAGVVGYTLVLLLV